MSILTAETWIPLADIPASHGQHRWGRKPSPEMVALLEQVKARPEQSLKVTFETPKQAMMWRNQVMSSNRRWFRLGLRAAQRGIDVYIWYVEPTL